MHIQLEVLFPYAYRQPIPLPLSYQEILIIENINLSRKRRKIVSKVKMLKKTNSENVSTPKVVVFNVEFALKLRIYRSLKSLICLKCIRKKFSTTLHTQFNYLTWPVTPFNLENKYFLFVGSTCTLFIFNSGGVTVRP